MDTAIRASLAGRRARRGVSLATVDRVLPRPRRRACAYGRAASPRCAPGSGGGYRPDPAGSAPRAANRSIKDCVRLPTGTNSFITLLNHQVQALTSWLAEQRAAAVVQTVDVFSPVALARHLRGCKDSFDAVVVMASIIRRCVPRSTTWSRHGHGGGDHGV